ncbi:MAG: 3-keto-5-aminohexanoate cleavage protein [Lachnospiraceae bacterium]|nr:3-keto-5-aminohexanoate cleavage protein [Lachnospiraceae bacterium]
MKKTIITAAITGAIHIPSQSKYLPIAPDEIADESIAACKAGAAVAHIHVRDPKDGRPTPDMELFRYVCKKVKENCDVILCLTTGGDPTTMTIEQRLLPVTELQPEVASLNGGSLNFALHPLAERIEEYRFNWEKEYLLKTENNIHNNTFYSMRKYIDTFYNVGTKPEFEVYEIGHINNIAYFVKQGKIKAPVYLQFVLGVLGGMQATVENLIYLVSTAEKAFGKDSFIWSVVGAGKQQMSLGAVALAMGGHVRVGLEDSIWLSKGEKAKSNAQQVEKIVRIAKELSKEVATADEARAILGVKGLDMVAF